MMQLLMQLNKVEKREKDLNFLVRRPQHFNSALCICEYSANRQTYGVIKSTNRFDIRRAKMQISTKILCFLFAFHKNFCNCMPASLSHSAVFCVPSSFRHKCAINTAELHAKFILKI